MKKEKKDLCTLYLIRHGETEWNRDHIIMGHKDSPLTAQGLEQAHELCEALAPIRFSALYSSDSPRAKKTAEIVKGKRVLPITDSFRLRERNSGPFEGMTRTEFLKKNAALLKHRSSLPEPEQWTFKLHDSEESHEEMLGRVIEALHEIAQRHSGETVLVSTHGGPIRFLLMKLGVVPFGSLPAGSFKNAGYAVCTSDGERLEIKQVEGIVK